jgi:hypothetical protein
MEQMADEKRVRFPRWAMVIAILLIALPGLVYCLHLYIHALEERRWAEMRRWCEEAAREIRARDSKRPVLRGEALPGNAWDDYREGLASLPNWKVLSPVAEFVNQSPKADRAKALGLVELHAPALQALRRGASRSHSDRNPDWENQKDLWSSRHSNFTALAAGRARFLAEE